MMWDITSKRAQTEISEQEFSRAIHFKLNVEALFLCS